MTGAGEYFWRKTIVFFLSDLFEHCKMLYLKRDAWIFHCVLFVSCPHSLCLLNIYMDGYFLEKKVVWYFMPRKLCGGYVSRGFSSGQPVDICLFRFFF